MRNVKLNRKNNNKNFLDVLVLNKQRNCQKTQDGQKEEND
jgi:hypothetical protein